MYTLAISKFDIPGEAGFPLNSVYAKPATASDAGENTRSLYPSKKTLFQPSFNILDCFRSDEAISSAAASRDRR